MIHGITKCNLCHHDEAKILYVIGRFRIPFAIVKCPKCGLIYQWRKDEDVDKFYSEGYFAGKNEYSYIDEREDKFLRDIENNRRLLNLLKFVNKHEHKRPLLLDIGCSFGALVRNAGELGIDACGIDVSKYIEKIAISPYIKQGDACNKIDGKYDIITMVEVIEHLRNPSKALMNCYYALNDGGIMLIQTTNMDSLVRKIEKGSSRYFLPGHLFYFSLRTLTKLLEKKGFKVEKVYFGHETGLIPAIIRKSIANTGRFKLPDWVVLLYTLLCQLGSKLHTRNLAVHNGMVVIARKVRR